MASVATGADIATSVGTRRRRYMERKSLLALLLFLPPALILFTLFIVLPMVDAATFSFFDWNGYGPITDFVGFENYADVLTHRNFGTAVRNSLIVVAVSLVIQLPLAMWCAIALSERGVHINVLRTLFFLPFMLAEVAAGLIWKFVYADNAAGQSFWLAGGWRPRGELCLLQRQTLPGPADSTRLEPTC